MCSTKFYTEDGNYDLVGLSWPIFFVRDPMMGPDNIRFVVRCAHMGVYGLNE